MYQNLPYQKIKVPYKAKGPIIVFYVYVPHVQSHHSPLPPSPQQLVPSLLSFHYAPSSLFPPKIPSPCPHPHTEGFESEIGM